MVPAIDVARYLIRIAAPTEDEDADYLTHMRVHKLMYYIQGWHLASFNRPLFNGRIEAWRHGPVVKEVYTTLKEFAAATIPPHEGAEPSTLSEKDKIFIRGVWGQYKQYSATALRAMTHREDPWKNVYRAGSDGRGGDEITAEALLGYFSPRLKERIFKSDSKLNPSLWEATAAAMNEKRVCSVQEIRRDLQHSRTRADEG